MLKILFAFIVFTHSAYASNFGYDKDGIPVACTLDLQSGATDNNFCRNSVSRSRCFAEVTYRNGRRQRFWGERCVVWNSDCASGAPASVRPACSNIEDL
jgi:hypothetical protein